MTLDVEMHLRTISLVDTIIQNNVSLAQDHAKVIIFFPSSSSNGLKN